jgi:hypothetical protein
VDDEDEDENQVEEDENRVDEGEDEVDEDEDEMKLTVLTKRILLRAMLRTMLMR